MQRDPKSAEMLSRLQKDMGTTRLVNEINRDAAALHANYTRSHVHYWTQMKRPIPPEVTEWINKEAFVRLTPWGSFAFLGQKAPWLEMLLDALRRPDADLDAALDVALRLEKAGDILPERPVAPDTWPSVAALIGTLYRVKGVLGEARNAFERSVELARKFAPQLLPRYQTNLLNIRREVRWQELQRKLISPEAWREYLRATLAEQQEVLRGARLEADQTLALRHCLRMSSLLDDRKAFAGFLTEARKCKGFGAIPEDRDRALARFMGAEHDEDGDFANAREYRCFMELTGSE